MVELALALGCLILYYNPQRVFKHGFKAENIVAHSTFRKEEKQIVFQSLVKTMKGWHFKIDQQLHYIMSYNLM